MSRNPDGSHSCDRCGDDVGNGGLATSVVIADYEPDTPGVPRSLNLCRDVVEDGQVTKPGCAGVVLSRDNLAHFYANRSPRG